MALISKQLLLLGTLILGGSVSADLLAATSVSSAATKSKAVQHKNLKRHVVNRRVKVKYAANKPAKAASASKSQAEKKPVAKWKVIVMGFGEGAIELAGGRGIGQANGPGLLPGGKVDSRKDIIPDVFTRSSRSGKSRFP